MIAITLVVAFIMSVIINYRAYKFRMKCLELARTIHVENYLDEFNGDIDKAANKATKLIDDIYLGTSNNIWIFLIISISFWKPINSYHKHIII